MHLKILEIIFGLSSFALILLMLLRELGITKRLSPMRASDYISSMAAFLLAYITFAFLLAIFIPSGLNKIIFALFGISPFIIGKLVTYYTVKRYSILQILCVILSLVYITTI